MGDKVVPDTMWGLCVWYPCAIHDHMYRNKMARTLYDKWVADVVLLTNLSYWIEAKTNSRIVRAARRYRAMTYFQAVRDGGKKSFFNGKEFAT